MKRNLRFLFLIIFYFCILNFVGCEAFGKKFIRKHKDTDSDIEMVLEPQEYPEHPAPTEEIYRETFGFWKNWHEALIDSLSSQDNNAKKQKECVVYALDNLNRLKSLLREDKAKELEKEIKELTSAKERIEKSVLTEVEKVVIRNNLERQELRIDSRYVYSKVKNYLVR
jgi:hypothetical protein